MFLGARVFAYKIRRVSEVPSPSVSQLPGPVPVSSAPIPPPANAVTATQNTEFIVSAAEKVRAEIERLKNLATRLERDLESTANSSELSDHPEWDLNALVDLQAKLERPRRDLSALLDKRPLYARQQS